MTLTPEQLKSIKAGDVLGFAPGYKLKVTYNATWADGQGVTFVYGEWGLYEYRCDKGGKNDGGCRVLDIIAINPPEAPPNTVRVKIMVGVDKYGDWGAGHEHSWFPANSRLSWVYANVPLPEMSEIEGEVG